MIPKIMRICFGSFGSWNNSVHVSSFSQETAALPREGLPYWILWLLLCIILLLMTFIFLRDKELRRRLDSFLSGAKRRVKRTQLQVKLNKEKKKKIDLLKDLGKRTWCEKIKSERCEPIFKTLETLEKKMVRLQLEMKEILSKIMHLKNQHEEIRQELKNLSKIKEERKKPDRAALQERKEKERLLKKEIKERENTIKRSEKAIQEIEGLKEAHFEQLGTITDEQRIDHKEFPHIYAEIDRINRTILQLMNQIEELF